jgi:hypothetical protein
VSNHLDSSDLFAQAPQVPCPVCGSADGESYRIADPLAYNGTCGWCGAEPQEGREV